MEALPSDAFCCELSDAPRVIAIRWLPWELRAKFCHFVGCHIHEKRPHSTAARPLLGSETGQGRAAYEWPALQFARLQLRQQKQLLIGSKTGRGRAAYERPALHFAQLQRRQQSSSFSAPKRAGNELRKIDKHCNSSGSFELCPDTFKTVQMVHGDMARVGNVLPPYFFRAPRKIYDSIIPKESASYTGDTGCSSNAVLDLRRQPCI